MHYVIINTFLIKMYQITGFVRREKPTANDHLNAVPLDFMEVHGLLFNFLHCNCNSFCSLSTIAECQFQLNQAAVSNGNALISPLHTTCSNPNDGPTQLATTW